MAKVQFNKECIECITCGNMFRKPKKTLNEKSIKSLCKQFELLKKKLKSFSYLTEDAPDSADIVWDSGIGKKYYDICVTFRAHHKKKIGKDLFLQLQQFQKKFHLAEEAIPGLIEARELKPTDSKKLQDEIDKHKGEIESYVTCYLDWTNIINEIEMEVNNQFRQQIIGERPIHEHGKLVGIVEEEEISDDSGKDERKLGVINKVGDQAIKNLDLQPELDGIKSPVSDAEDRLEAIVKIDDLETESLIHNPGFDGTKSPTSLENRPDLDDLIAQQNLEKSPAPDTPSAKTPISRKR